MKVMLISHNCFSTYTNMGKTFLSLFSQFEKGELCQLYIYPSLPDVDMCGGYFQVTDKDVLKGLFSRKNAGREIDINSLDFGASAQYEDENDRQLYKNKRNTTAVVRILRDALWQVGKWRTENLDRWLEKEKPDCIFLAPGYAKFIYDVALEISMDYQLPIVTYICDDYYFVKTPGKMADKLQLALLKGKISRLFEKTSHLVTICREMEQAYTQEFDVSCDVISTGATLQSGAKEAAGSNFSYFGNIGNNRYVSIADIGRALDEINARQGTQYRLNIYTAEKNSRILEILDQFRSLQIREFVSGREFEKEFWNSRLLLHTEAFDEKNMDLVKHSVSTKIADSLASGIPLIAYGPESISSMQHLIRNSCAFVATSKDELKTVLLEALENDRARKKVSEAAIAAAGEYHHSRKNSLKLKRIFEEVISGCGKNNKNKQ